jgi:hypothetical protein
MDNLKYLHGVHTDCTPHQGGLQAIAQRTKNFPKTDYQGNVIKHDYWPSIL